MGCFGRLLLYVIVALVLINVVGLPALPLWYKVFGIAFVVFGGGDD